MEATDSIERRAHSRAELPAAAVLLRVGVDAGRYVVQNLSAAGALLTGDADVAVGSPLELRLEIGGRAPVVVKGRVIRRARTIANLVALAVSFRHRSPDTEDAIQQAVLDALEIAVRSEPFFKDVRHYY
jgi:hypothetical protein